MKINECLMEKKLTVGSAHLDTAGTTKNRGTGGFGQGNLSIGVILERC
jgi:hypothetical protein